MHLNSNYINGKSFNIFIKTECNHPFRQNQGNATCLKVRPSFKPGAIALKHVTVFETRLLKIDTIPKIRATSKEEKYWLALEF